MNQLAKIEKRVAHLIHFGHGDRWEFYGVFPEPRPDVIDRGAYSEIRHVTRDDLERIKEDDVTDAEWLLYAEARS